MLVKYHILLGILFSFSLVYFFNISPSAAVVIFLSSVLIDIDHYILYICKTRDFSLKNAYNYSVKSKKIWLGLSPKKREKYKTSFMFLHGIEFLALLVALSFLSKFFFYIFLGVFFHLLADWLELLYLNLPLYLKFSQMYVFIRNKNKKPFAFS